MPKKSKVQAVPPVFHQHSPIDITESVAAVLPPLQFHYKSVAFGQLEPTSDNHGYNVKIDGDAGFIEVGSIKANLVQLHFHSKSEHHVHGKEYAMELHLVHEILQPKTPSVLMVIGVFFEIASKRKPAAKNPSSFQLLKSLVLHKPTKPTDPFDPHHLLPEDPLGYFGYYRYEGSLTTGNLDEKVSWLVLRHPVSCVRSDIAPLIAAANHDDLDIQSLNRRFVLRNF